MVSKKRALVSSIATVAMLTGSGVSANPFEDLTFAILAGSIATAGYKLLKDPKNQTRISGAGRRAIKVAGKGYDIVKSGGKIDSKFLSDGFNKVVTPDLEDGIKCGEVFNIEDDLSYNTSKDRVDGIYRFSVDNKVFYFSFVAFSDRLNVVLEESREKVSNLVENIGSKISLNCCREYINKIEGLEDTINWTKQNLLGSVIRRALPDDCSFDEEGRGHFFVKDYLVPVFDAVFPIGGKTVIRLAKKDFDFEKRQEQLGKNVLVKGFMITYNV